MTAGLLPFPTSNITNIPEGLRAVADSVENGEFGDAHQLVWAIKSSDGLVEVGLIGSSASPRSDAFLILGAAQLSIIHGWRE